MVGDLVLKVGRDIIRGNRRKKVKGKIVQRTMCSVKVSVEGYITTRIESVPLGR